MRNLKYKKPGRFEHRIDEESMNMLYSYLRHYKPVNVVEIGTWYGGATCCIGKALEENNLNYKFTAFELMEELRETTKNNFKEHTKAKVKLLGDVTKSKKNIPDNIDFLLIDTDHDRETTEWIIKNVMSKVKKGGIVFIHDWTIDEKDGEYFIRNKHHWPEMEVIVEMMNKGTFPLEKIYWTKGRRELGILKKI